MNDREKLIELLDGIIDGGFKWHSYSYESGEQLNNDEIASNLIAHGVTVQKWISVKDRLPDKEEYTAKSKDGTEYYVRFLIAYKTDIVEYEIGYYDGYKWMTEMPIRLIKDVVAWMPFPNMPQHASTAERRLIMAKKQKEPVKTCADCIHEYACSMWNIGTLHWANATNCTNYETVRDSAAYLIGKMERGAEDGK